MATNYTEHYGLCQWEPGDKFIREEFNQDFLKIDTVLGSLKQKEEELDRVIYHLSHTIYDLNLKDYYASQYYGYRRAMFLELFITEDNVSSLEGELFIDNGDMLLPWTAEPATMTTVPIDLSGISWSRVVAWVKCDAGADYAMTVNGAPMRINGIWETMPTKGTKCQEIELVADVSGRDSAVFTLTLTPHERYVPRVFEYGAVFL